MSSSISSKHDSENAPRPAPFLQLFRFATKKELSLNVLGIFTAIAAGTAQPLMSLFLGNLSQSTIDFLIARGRILDGTDNTTEYDEAKIVFLRAVSKNASYLAVIGLGVFLCTSIYMNIWTYTGEMNTNRLRERYLRAVVHQDVAFFDDVGPGEISTRIQNDTHLVQQATSEKVAIIAQHLSAFTTGFVLAFARCWQLAIILIYLVVFIFLTGFVMTKFVSKYLGLGVKNVGEAGSIAEETISSIRTTQAFSLAETMTKLYDAKISKAEKAEIYAAAYAAVAHASLYILVYSSYGLAFWYGTKLVVNGVADVGLVLSVQYSIMVGSLSLAFMTSEIKVIAHGRIAAKALFETINRQPVINSDDERGFKPSAIGGEVSFSGVAFQYPSRPHINAIDNLTISFPARRVSALVGRSGAGKSTIFHLLERFYDPTEGDIRIDGVDIRKWNIKYLRSQIGLVSQEPVLFSTTIKENIALGLLGTPYEHASSEKKETLIHQAAKTANADEFIRSLPDGYDTTVGERGVLLSGGQKQRVAIARAIVSNPSILLLDEATSALDTHSEKVVQEALDKASEGRTTIVIAHRLSTIKNADRIFVMNHGVIIEDGTHNELMHKNGHYAQMITAQSLQSLGRSVSGQSLESSPSETSSSKRTSMEKTDLDPESKMSSAEMFHDLHTLPSVLKSGVQDNMSGKNNLEFRYEYKEYSAKTLFSRLGTVTPGIRKGYLIAIVFSILTGLMMPSFGIVYAEAVIAYRNVQDPAKLRSIGDRTGLVFFFIALYGSIACGMQHFLFGRTGAKLTAYLRSKVFAIILNQKIEFFDLEKHNTGSLLSKLTENPQKVSGLAGSVLGQLFQCSTTILVGPVIGLAFSWNLALVAISTMPLLVTAGYIRVRVMVLKDQQSRRNHDEAARIACEAVASLRALASLTGEDNCCHEYGKRLRAPLQRAIRVDRLANLVLSASVSMQYFILALVFWYGSQLLASLKIGPLAFFVCLFSVTLSAIQVGNVFAFTKDVSVARTAANELVGFLDLDSQNSKAFQEKTLTREGEIVFNGIRFSYPSRPHVNVLRGLGITVPSGSKIALVGPSGGGKSTIFQLLARFYEPHSGTICVNGVEISSIDVREIRRRIAIVSQEPTLFSGTIRFNLLLGAADLQSEVSEQQIEEACLQANILDFIKSLPEGLETQVGNKAVQLSGGQKQRLAIARALLRDPSILLLDEATSALDSSSERLVQEALDRASIGRTTLTIAHRLSTIQGVDCIYFIKNGRVNESGTHAELIARSGDYCNYVSLQNFKSDDERL